MMGIKRKIEENDIDSDKKTKLNQTFSNEIFIKNLKDPETSFLGKFYELYNKIDNIFFF